MPPHQCSPSPEVVRHEAQAARPAWVKVAGGLAVVSAVVMGTVPLVRADAPEPSKTVRAGDIVEVTVGVVRRTVQVLDVAERRGSASVAAMLYAETPESIATREQHAAEQRLARPLGADSGARPTEQERRRLEALRRGMRRRGY